MSIIEATRCPTGAVAVAADLADEDCAARIFAAAEGLPPVALLVNNAARFAEDRLETFDAAGFDSHMAVNVRAPALLTQMFAARAGDAGGLVVNLLDAKLAAPNPDYLSYTLSKMALAGLTELSGAGAGRAGDPGQRHRAGADAPVRRAGRKQFRGDAPLQPAWPRGRAGGCGRRRCAI